MLAACGESDAASVAVTATAAPTVDDLRDRLHEIHGAMGDLEQAEDVGDARAAAERVVNLIAGLDGRHAGDLNGDGTSSDLHDVGVFPPDSEDEVVLGLALVVHDALGTNEAVKAAISGVIAGDRSAWSAPERRYDEVDRAVEVTSGGQNAVRTMDGHLMRAMAWALLAAATDDIDAAREFAGHGRLHTQLSLDALEVALTAP